jgi:hypothetical protein
MSEVAKKAYAIRDLHRILDGPSMTPAQSLYHAFEYAREMHPLLLDTAASIQSMQAPLTEHLRKQAPLLVEALRTLARHARAFCASPEMDALLQQLKAGSPSQTSLDVLDGFIDDATHAEAQVAAAKPSAVWLSPDQVAPQEVFDLLQGPYLAAMDYIQYFRYDVNELRDRLRPTERT